ncbi:MAG: DEDD exonuclease domain-containing protein, partial [Actinomycetota bacterium]|nr:DEDD exonuclease domain-containing protein [Actinomycetota bacterium]
MLVGQRTFEDMGAPLHEVPFCVLDLETTGTTAASCEITEFGAVSFLGGEPTGTFQTLVNPGTDIPPFITVLTGITQAMVIEAPAIGEALPSFLEFIGDAVIVGHNIRFDMSFLNAAAVRLGYGRLPNRTIDTLGLSRRLVRTEVRNLKLSSLAAYFQAPSPPTHRALDDAKATAHIFWSLLERAGTLGVTHLDDLLTLPTARGSSHYGKISLTEDLPRKPGVYFFVDRDGTVIYVGKAKNLRTRVRSYFYGDNRKSVAQMLRDLVRVDYRVCETEIEAEVTELLLIGEHRPRYNRRSRPPRSQHWVKLTTERFPRLSLVRTMRDDGASYLGPFRSRQAADAVVHAIWDAAPIRRCNGSGTRRTAACSIAQLGTVLCPCDGDVDAEAYREVVDRVRAGMLSNPPLLLDALRDRMARLAESRRYEDAAVARDRHELLGRAIERRRAWLALAAAGTLWAEDADGDGVVVGHGHLVASWNASTPLPLAAMDDPAEKIPQAPVSVAAAEEAHLIWRWLNRDGVRLVQSTGTLTLPIQPVPTL